jgi:hypothetical protein
MYAVVAWALAGSETTGAVGDALPEMLIWVLVVVAVAQLLIAPVVWRAMVRAASARPTPAERLAGYRRATIVAFALREGTALIGFVLNLLDGDLRWCLGLSALAMVAMLLDWPRRTDVIRLAAAPETAPIR